MKKQQTILWEVGCEGHTDAWVVAENWELATVEAADFWGVPWREVAAKCEQKGKTVGAPSNICCRCGRVYFAPPPMCETCRKSLLLEEEETKRRVARAYREGRAV